MEKIDTQLKQLSELATLATSQSLAEFDFDRLKTTLDTQRELLMQYSAVVGDLDALRKDYIERIAGMAKAIAVVTRYSDPARQADMLKAALDYVSDLESCSAADLIEHYQLTSARFRDAFPTTFAHLHPKASPY